jgi:hypothetical protein
MKKKFYKEIPESEAKTAPEAEGTASCLPLLVYDVAEILRLRNPRQSLHLCTKQ